MANLYQANKDGRGIKTYTVAQAGDIEYIGGGFFLGAVGVQAALFRLDESGGNVRIVKIFLNILSGAIVGITYDGAFVYAMTRNTAIPNQYFVQKIDWNGNILWSRVLGGTVRTGLCRDTFDSNNVVTRGEDGFGYYTINKDASPDTVQHIVFNKGLARIVETFSTGRDDIESLTFDGDFFWLVTSDATASIIKLDRTGNQLNAITGLSTIKGITTDGFYLYLSAT